MTTSRQSERIQQGIAKARQAQRVARDLRHNAVVRKWRADTLEVLPAVRALLDDLEHCTFTYSEKHRCIWLSRKSSSTATRDGDVAVGSVGFTENCRFRLCTPDRKNKYTLWDPSPEFRDAVNRFLAAVPFSIFAQHVAHFEICGHAPIDKGVCSGDDVLRVFSGAHGMFSLFMRKDGSYAVAIEGFDMRLTNEPPRSLEQRRTYISLSREQALLLLWVIREKTHQYASSHPNSDAAKGHVIYVDGFAVDFEECVMSY